MMTPRFIPPPDQAALEDTALEFVGGGAEKPFPQVSLVDVVNLF